MSCKLIISVGCDFIVCFLLDNLDVKEIRVERREKTRLLGSIFKGKIKRLAKGMDGFFIDIGLDREAYLPYKKYENNSSVEHICTPTIGSEVLVQVKREPEDDKGPKVSCKISLPGKYVVYLPCDNAIHFSSKIPQKKREFFSRILSSYVKNEGIIVRTAALKTSVEDIIDELNYLKYVWQETKARAKSKRTPGLVYEELPLYLRFIRDNCVDLEEIVVNNSDIWKEIFCYLENELPFMITRVKYVKDISIYFRMYELDKVINSIFNKYIWLKSGGYIVIEETEAMTVIDVNSGSYCKTSLEHTALEINLEAVDQIAKHIKLRNIGGIIVIDFIDMKNAENKQKVLSKLASAFQDESNTTQIFGMTRLGLVEMSRKKSTPSLTKILSTHCPYCKGRGYVKSPEFVIYEIEKELSCVRGGHMEIRVNPLIKERVENVIGKKQISEWVTVKEDRNIPVDYYEMVYLG